MNGNELLRPGGEKRGGLDASLAAEDLELTRLSQLLFPGLGAEEALDFAFGLLTDDGETIRLRQEILGDLLDHPALRETMEKLRGILEELETCSRGVRDNLTGMKVSRLDAAVDGLKKAVLKLEKNLSQQGADILEENAADNRYAQLLRFTHFRRRLTRLGWCFARENPRQRHVFQRRHRHDQIERLEDVSHLVAADPRQLLLVQIGQRISVDLHMAFRRAVEAAHHVEERRFAGAGRPQNRQIFTTADIEIDSAQRMDFFRAHRIDFRHAARLHNDIFLSAHSSTLMASTGCFFAAM